MERMVNKMIMVILAAMVTLTTVTLIGSLVWGADNRNDLYYICERVNRHGVPSLFHEGCDSDNTAPPGTRWFTFFIIYTNFVPLSLSVRKSNLRPSRHRRDTCSMAWRCRFLTGTRHTG